MVGATAPAIFFGLGVRLRALEGKRADSARTARGPAVLLAEGPCFYCQTATQFHCPTAGHPLPIRLWNAIGHANPLETLWLVPVRLPLGGPSA